MTVTYTNDGHLGQTEMFLVHGDVKWKQYRPSESNESVKQALWLTNGWRLISAAMLVTSQEDDWNSI
jgi:hypothetical protein